MARTWVTFFVNEPSSITAPPIWTSFCFHIFNSNRQIMGYLNVMWRALFKKKLRKFWLSLSPSTNLQSTALDSGVHHENYHSGEHPVPVRRRRPVSSSLWRHFIAPSLANLLRVPNQKHRTANFCELLCRSKQELPLFQWTESNRNQTGKICCKPGFIVNHSVTRQH